MPPLTDLDRIQGFKAHIRVVRGNRYVYIGKCNGNTKRPGDNLWAHISKTPKGGYNTTLLDDGENKVAALQIYKGGAIPQASARTCHILDPIISKDFLPSNPKVATSAVLRIMHIVQDEANDMEEFDIRSAMEHVLDYSSGSPRLRTSTVHRSSAADRARPSKRPRTGSVEMITQEESQGQITGRAQERITSAAFANSNEHTTTRRVSATRPMANEHQTATDRVENIRREQQLMWVQVKRKKEAGDEMLSAIEKTIKSLEELKSRYPAELGTNIRTLQDVCLQSVNDIIQELGPKGISLPGELSISRQQPVALRSGEDSRVDESSPELEGQDEARDGMENEEANMM